MVLNHIFVLYFPNHLSTIYKLSMVTYIFATFIFSDLYVKITSHVWQVTFLLYCGYGHHFYEVG